MFEDVIISSNEFTEQWNAPILEDGGESAPESAARLCSLPPQDRAVLLLWDAGMGCTEIADRSALPIDAVGRILDRVRHQSSGTRDASSMQDITRCGVELTEMDLLFNSAPR